MKVTPSPHHRDCSSEQSLKIIPVMQCVSVACITGLPIEGKIAPVGFNGGSTPDPRPALRRASSAPIAKRVGGRECLKTSVTAVFTRSA